MLLSVFTGSPASAGVALLYHHVDKSTPAITSITPAQFERHLEIIEAEGFTVRTLSDLASDALAGVEPRAKEVAITFDDAYISIYETAFPLLKQRNWPFTIFVATDYVSDTNPHYLSWKQLAEMAEHGASIENHTMSHAHLLRRQPQEDESAWRERIRREIVDALAVLAERGYSSGMFAYPYGEYDLQIIDLLKELNLTGFGQQSGAMGPESNPQLLPRFPLAGAYVGEAAFRDKLNSLAMPAQYAEPDPLVSGDFSPPLNFTLDPAIKASGLTCYGPGGLMKVSSTDNTITVTPAHEIPIGRSRYNCTLPAGEGRFYWLSQLWIRRLDDGSWYPEP